LGTKQAANSKTKQKLLSASQDKTHVTVTFSPFILAVQIEASY
jgi:hypothetical protein